MYEDIKREATDKFFKVKLYLNELSSSLPSPPSLPSEFHNTLKGLFFVYLYGIYEMVITKTIGRTINNLNASGAKISECKYELLSLILSPEYDALYQAGDNTKWPKRWNVSQKLIEDQPISIVEALFPTDGKNIRNKQLESLNNCFGNIHSVLPRPEIHGYLEELVQQRNNIAHGNFLPQDIGRNYSIEDLEKRLTSIDLLCTYFIDIYEKYISDHEYLKVT